MKVDIITIFLDFNGIVFCGDPIHQRITSQGATVQPPDSGIALHIPKQALLDMDLLICLVHLSCQMAMNLQAHLPHSD